MPRKTAVKVKAQPVVLGNLVALNCYEKTFSSGKRGFFGKVQDISSGKRYQIIGAVEIVPKAS